MHHARHYASHSHKREILNREIKTRKKGIQQKRKKEPGHTTYIKRGRKSAAHAARSIGGGSGEAFEGDNQPDI